MTSYVEILNEEIEYLKGLSEWPLDQVKIFKEISSQFG